MTSLPLPFRPTPLLTENRAKYLATQPQISVLVEKAPRAITQIVRPNYHLESICGFKASPPENRRTGKLRWEHSSRSCKAQQCERQQPLAETNTHETNNAPKQELPTRQLRHFDD